MAQANNDIIRTGDPYANHYRQPGCERGCQSCNITCSVATAVLAELERELAQLTRNTELTIGRIASARALVLKSMPAAGAIH